MFDNLICAVRISPDTCSFSIKLLIINVKYDSIERLYYGDENIAFITSESNDGRKIVNSIYLLWSKGVITYYENYISDSMPIYDDRCVEKVGVYLNVVEHHDPIRRLIKQLDDFEHRKDTYQDPDSYLEMLLNSVANEINKEISERNTKIVGAKVPHPPIGY